MDFLFHSSRVNQLAPLPKTLYYTVRLGFYLAVIVTSVFIFILDGGVFRGGDNDSVLERQLAMFIIDLGVLYQSFFAKSRAELFGGNHTIASRQKQISRLLSYCKTDLLIVSGEFFGEVFNSDAVIAMLQAIGDDVRVELYSTSGDVDPNATEFIRLIRKKNWTIRTVNDDSRHIIVVDRKHTRVESREVSKDRRPADYQYGNPRRAGRFIRQFRDKALYGPAIDLFDSKSTPQQSNPPPDEEAVPSSDLKSDLPKQTAPNPTTDETDTSPASSPPADAKSASNQATLDGNAVENAAEEASA